MDINQMQQEISIIKQMIEKTRRETASSGHLLIFIGIFSAIATAAIGLMGIYKLNNLIQPVVVFMVVVNAIAGFIIASKEDREEKVKVYPKIIFWNLWIVCGITALIIVFLFPFLKVYPFSAVPVIVCLIMGIALFMTGIIYEMKFVQWSSSAWWIGAIWMAISDSQYEFIAMVVVIIIGWVVPGFLLNKQYKNRRN
jgi:hypothetical protein